MDHRPAEKRTKHFVTWPTQLLLPALNLVRTEFACARGIDLARDKWLVVQDLSFALQKAPR